MFPFQVGCLLSILQKLFVFFTSVTYSLGQVLYLKALFQLQTTFSPFYTNTCTGVQVQTVSDMSCPGDLLSPLASSSFFLNCQDQ